MHELITLELEAMQDAHDAVWPLDAAGRRRAVMWLAARLTST